MPPPESPPSPDADQPTIDEARMRRALGLDRPSAAPSPQQRPAQQRPTQQRPEQMRPEQARMRHRFVQDGEVSVEVMDGARRPGGAWGEDAAVALQVDLRAEQQARAVAERSLAEARTTVQALHTQLAHAEMAHAEALAAERRAREGAEAALRDAVTARDTAEQRLREAAPVPTAAPAPAGGASSSELAAKQRRVGRPAREEAAEPAQEPEPVAWWLPGWKTRVGR